ncbi:MAG: ketoacyl-ACP synthase III [Gammaproteobacteria bacterium]
MGEVKVGIVGTGLYIPEPRMSAAEIAAETGGVWSAKAVEEKLGIVEKTLPGEEDGTQEMGVRAGLDLLRRTGVDPRSIDVVLCIGEEWKEYPLTTSGIYIQERIGATNAWAIDVQQRCCTAVAAMKMARDMIVADPEIDTVLVVGGYRNCDLIDFSDPTLSMMYNLAAGGGAILLKRNHPVNHLLGTHLMSDGTMARDAGVRYGGINCPIDESNLHKARRSLCLFNPEHMKARLNAVSMDNWMRCIERAFGKAGIDRRRLGYLAILHIKRSMHRTMLEKLGLSETQSIYLEHYGHIGQIDPILSLHLALERGRVADGTVVCMVAAGIGYAWAANVIRWGG